MSEDFLGSSALAFDIAPASTKALNKSPSIVFSWLLLKVVRVAMLCLDLRVDTHSCMPLYPVPE